MPAAAAFVTMAAALTNLWAGTSLSALTIPPPTLPPTGIPFTGRFELASPPEELAARQKAVDDAVNEFFFLVRPIARARLEPRTEASAWIELAQSDERVFIRFSGAAQTDCAIGGTAEWKDPDGEKILLAVDWDGKTLVQSMTAKDGRRVNTFEAIPAAQGGGVRLGVRMESKKLDKPITYRLTYKPAAAK